ncbi:hypothetical protein BDV98DRAFT_570665 [Pterulicium gracile]|uniref:Uncharacterized protein n=1 Tax=Pterulicium gracile TaxID=1884261 RepID=A0A5C3QHM3_9AGAR|nr:hypothetical protein BDV98DRAFT_570665 [Pterula gracilis]
MCPLQYSPNHPKRQLLRVQTIHPLPLQIKPRILGPLQNPPPAYHPRTYAPHSHPPTSSTTDARDPTPSSPAHRRTHLAEPSRGRSQGECRAARWTMCWSGG